MKMKWYDSDWFVCLMSGIGLASMIVANFLFHGGHLIW